MMLRRAALLSAAGMFAMGLISTAYAVDATSHIETNTTRGFRADAVPLTDPDKRFIREEVEKAPPPADQTGGLQSNAVLGAHVDETVKLHQLPAAAVERVPSYHLYQYFITKAGAIVIVNPDTRIVVQTIGG